MNIQQILDQVPRLRAWVKIGPVQRSELEQFAQLLLDSQATAVTADGVLVTPGTKVYVFSSTGSVQSTTVQQTEAVTDYYLFGQIPVAHSFSSREAALNYQKHNQWNPHTKLPTTIVWPCKHNVHETKALT